MVFGFYDNLTSRQQSIYRQSDEIKYLRLAETSQLTALANELVETLPTENKKAVEKICQTIVDTINNQFNAPPLKLQVLAVRPSADWGNSTAYTSQKTMVNLQKFRFGCGQQKIKKS